MTSLVKEHGRQCMSRSINVSMTLKSIIFSTEFLDFLKKNILSFHSLFKREWKTIQTIQYKTKCSFPNIIYYKIQCIYYIRIYNDSAV